MICVGRWNLFISITSSDEDETCTLNVRINPYGNYSNIMYEQGDSIHTTSGQKP